MRIRLAAAVAVAAALGAACLSIPPYQPRALVSYVEDGSGGATVSGPGTVTGPGFTLHFAGGDSFHLPDDLEIGDSKNLLGHDAMSRCTDESGTGMLVQPAARISADGSVMPMKNKLVPMMSGPAVVQVKVDWTTQFACDRSQTESGSSTFTVFPDRRIVRHDHLEDPDAGSLLASACVCPGGLSSTFFVTSYWAFAQKFQMLYDMDNVLGIDVPGAPGSTTPDTEDDLACLDGGTYQVTSRWVLPVATGVDRTPAQFFGTSTLVGHRLQQPSGSQMLHLPWDIHGVLLLSTDGCRPALNRAIAYTQPPTVMVNDVSVPASPLDGIYGGDPGDGSDPGIPLSDGHGTLLADAVPFAVWLIFPEPIDGVHATVPGVGGVNGSWYTPQRVNDRNWILWVQDPLTVKHTIRFEPF